jgi:ABC-2 type transport system ATP-binding protein
MDLVIKTKDLRKKFPIKKGFIDAVNGVDLEVNKGEIFGFLGPNGAGKSTTLKMLTTLLAIDSGEAIVAGFDVKTESNEVRKRIGYVSQKGGVDITATGKENLILQGNLHGLNNTQSKKQAERLLEIFSLTECAERFVSTYSGGQQRRLDIALSMMHKPLVLFLDEPTTGLDPQNRANLWDQLKSLKSEGVSIFLTSHYLDEIDFLSDRLAIMDKGIIIATGTANELKKQILGDIVTIGIDQKNHENAVSIIKKHSFVKDVLINNQKIYVYVDQGEKALVKILRLLDLEKISLDTISLSVPTLNDVFLQKTGKSLREGGPLEIAK